MDIEILSSSLFTENHQDNEDYFPAHAWYDNNLYIHLYIYLFNYLFIYI